MKKVSLIIPIYNTAAYLRRCLDSAVNQTYGNMEILCIDDGSTDGSEKIVDEYGKNFGNVIVIHQENKGESGARNVGLKRASGDYIGFMDCDDWIELDMYERLVYMMEKKQVDMVACGYFLSTDAGSWKAENEKAVSEEVFGRDLLFRYVYQRDYYRGVASYIWCKLFRRELLFNREGMLLFDEGVRLGGDLLFFMQAALQVHRVYYLPQAFYHYYQRDTSTVHSLDNITLAFERVQIYQELIDLLERERVELDTVIWLKRFKVYWASNIAETAYAQKDRRGLEKAKQVMREYEQEYIETNAGQTERLRRFREILDYQC